MSDQQNAEQFIRRMYDRWNAEGVAPVAEDFFDVSIDYEDDLVWPGGSAHHGRAAVIARFEEVIATLGLRQAVVERVVSGGDRVAWVMRTTGQSPGAELPNDHRWGYLGRISGGRLVYFRAYYDADEALRAVEE